MADSLLALLFVIESAYGCSIVFRWPPNPQAVPRLSRPRPSDASSHDLDNPWRAFQSMAHAIPHAPVFSDAAGDDDDYEWRAPSAAAKDRACSFSSKAASGPASGRASPELERSVASLALPADDEALRAPAAYRTVLGFNSKFLASLLAPARELCHQHFELVIDDLAFVGHPVCTDARGRWSFRAPSGTDRGRGERESPLPAPDDPAADADGALHTFHMVAVVDLPDPSAAGAGAVARHIGAVYEHVAFALAAALFHAQVTAGFVARECNAILAHREAAISAGAPHATHADAELAASGLARAMRDAFEGLRATGSARIVLAGMPLDLRLPLTCDAPAGVVLEGAERDPDGEPDDGALALAPWNALLLLDGVDVPAAGLPARGADRALAEGLVRLLESAEITLALADVAAALEWALEAQVYPAVRWLVQHRRARVIDVVHPRLKTRFALPVTFPRPLAELAAEFTHDFGPAAPPLPSLLAALTAPRAPRSPAPPAPCTVDVVRWLLQRALLVRLHLRVRVRVPPALKARVREQRARRSALASRGRGGRDKEAAEEEDEDEEDDVREESVFFPFSPRAARVRARGLRQSPLRSRSRGELDEKDSASESESSARDSDDDERAGDEGWSIVADPSAATARERRWLAAMSEGKEPGLAARFALVSQYFDGRRTDDEILYRAAITRRQFKEIIGAYSEYLEELLHP